MNNIHLSISTRVISFIVAITGALGTTVAAVQFEFLTSSSHDVSGIQSAQAHTGPLPHNIPDFSADTSRPRLRSTASGNWSDAATWGGTVPTANHVLHIDAGHTVTINNTSAQAYTLAIDGTLTFSPTDNTSLKVANLMVMEAGTLQVGTQANPINPSVTAEVIIANKPLDTTNDGTGVFDPEQYGTGFLGFGKVEMYGSAKTPTFARLATEPQAGATSIKLAEIPTGWKAGDKLFLPDTRQIAYSEKYKTKPPAPEWEEAVISSINGSTVTLTTALKYSHLGFRNEAGSTEHYPHVANLTRNVVVRSESATGTRGHVFLTHRADIDIAYVWFKDLGRTRVDTLNSTTFDTNGNVTAIGTNQIGRYTLHLHHLMGPVNPSNSGYQYTLAGNSLDSGLKWGLAIHNTHFGLVSGNTVYNFNGVGIMTEDGNESQNVIEKNMVGRVMSSRQKEAHDRGGILAPNGNVSDTGFEGSAFWFRGANNYVRDNVATDTSFSGYNYNGYYLDGVRIPNFRGADTNVTGEYTLYGSDKTAIKENIPVLEMTRNQAYGNMKLGMWLTWHGMCCDIRKYVNPSNFDDFLAWHVSHSGIEDYHESQIFFNRLTLKNNKTVTAQNTGGIRVSRGFDFSTPSYENGKHAIRDFHIEGFNIGIDMPARPDTGNPAENITGITNGYLKNYVNISEKLPAIRKVSELRNIQFQTLSIPAITGMPSSPKNIYMSAVQKSSADQKAIKMMLESRTYVYDFNGQAGNNFQVFFNEQAPSFIVPQSSDPEDGVPEANLTNTKAWAKYGRAIGGVNPANVCSTTRSDIYGFICPLP